MTRRCLFLGAFERVQLPLLSILPQEQISEMSGGMPMVPIVVLDQLRVR